MSVKVRSLRLVVFATAVLCLHAIGPARTEVHSQVPSTGYPPRADLKTSPVRSSFARLPVGRRSVSCSGWRSIASGLARASRLSTLAAHSRSVPFERRWRAGRRRCMLTHTPRGSRQSPRPDTADIGAFVPVSTD